MGPLGENGDLNVERAHTILSPVVLTEEYLPSQPGDRLRQRQLCSVRDAARSVGRVQTYLRKGVCGLSGAL